MNHPFSHNHRPAPPLKAFTLIEVLVVVAIIALLIAVLVPTLAESRRHARLLVCATNLRTLGQATVFYAQASRDEMPAGIRFDKHKRTYDYTRVSDNPWEVLYPFVTKVSAKAGDMFFQGGAHSMKLPTYTCPDDERQHTTSEAPYPPGSQNLCTWGLSYGANNNLLHRSHATDGARTMSSISRPSTMVTYSDAGNDTYDGSGGWILGDCMALIGQNQCEFEMRHKNGSNFAYLDTHVSFVKMTRASPQYGLPPFPVAFLPNWNAVTGPHRNYVRPAPRRPSY